MQFHRVGIARKKTPAEKYAQITYYVSDFIMV